MKHKRLTGKITAAALSVVMGCSGTLFFTAPPAYAAGYQKVDGYYQMLDGTVIDGVVARGIDVSRWQGDIDWYAVAADDVEFVMLGTRSKGDVDPYFHKNVKEASDAGIRVGAYIYSLATTPEMAAAEADFVLDLVKDYPISFPIAFDAEDTTTLGTLPPEQVAEIINTFCERIEAAGYYPIVYANDNWLANKIDMSNLDYDVWVARYETKHTFSDPIMWQATSTGSIQGISGNVDINFLYKDLNPYLPDSLWRTIGDKTFYYQNYQMQKDTWINDGTGWFYMNQEGLTSTGWLEKQGLYYYLDETTGRMVTGWQMLSDKWYFFNGSGAMSTGWLDDNGAKYFLNSDGSMATGWHTDGNSTYFLKDNGAAATGWRQLDETWYYFGQDGQMARGWINPDGNWYYLNEDGKMHTGWLEDGGAKYYTSTTSGKMTVGWRQIDGAWYYFNSSGAMVTGLTEINGQLYYLNPADGKMAASTTLDFDGVDYEADANGVCTKIEAAAESTPQDGQEQSGSENSQNTGSEAQDPAADSQQNTPPKESGPGIK